MIELKNLVGNSSTKTTYTQHNRTHNNEIRQMTKNESPIHIRLADPQQLYYVLEQTIPLLRDKDRRYTNPMGTGQKYCFVYMNKDRELVTNLYKSVGAGMYLGVICWRPRLKLFTVDGQFFEDNMDEVVEMGAQLGVKIMPQRQTKTKPRQ